MSALDKVAKYLAQLRRASTVPAESARVGAAFMQAAERPGTFVKGRSFADGVNGVMDQFDARLIDAPEDYERLYAYALRAKNDPTPHNRFFGQVRDGAPQVRASEPTDAEQAWLDTGYLSETDPIHTLETLDLRRNSGEGQALYPAAYGAMAQDPKAMNLSAGLSDSNQLRRNYAQANAVMRRPELSERILTDPSQLWGSSSRKWGSPEELLRFQTQGAEGQVGALQALAAHRALQGMSISPAASQVADFVDSPMDPEVIDALVKAWRLHSSAAPQALPFGDKSARRAGLALNALGENAPVPEWLTRGMEYAQGGSVGG